MQTVEEKRTYQREYMRRYNATEKGKAYNRAHVKAWRGEGKRKPEKRCTQSELRLVIKAFLLERDGNICGICKEELCDKIQIDHIISPLLGGAQVISNLQLAHATCNTLKGLEIRKQTTGY